MNQMWRVVAVAALAVALINCGGDDDGDVANDGGGGSLDGAVGGQGGAGGQGGEGGQGGVGLIGLPDLGLLDDAGGGAGGQGGEGGAGGAGGVGGEGGAGGQGGVGGMGGPGGGGGQGGEGGAGGAPLPDGRFVDLIRSDRYPRLVIEVDSVPGVEPNQMSLLALADRLGDVLDKPGGIEIQINNDVPAGGPAKVWEFEDLDAVVRGHYDLEVAADEIKIQIVYVDGSWHQDDEDGAVLALAWSHTHIAMFADTIAANCDEGGGVLGGPDTCKFAETTLLTHEVGHLLGLVDNGLPMVEDHKDPNEDHGDHDVSEDCVMFWAYDGTQGINSLLGGLVGDDPEPPNFDAQCRADIAAVRDAP